MLCFDSIDLKGETNLVVCLDVYLSLAELSCRREDVSPWLRDIKCRAESRVAAAVHGRRRRGITQCRPMACLSQKIGMMKLRDYSFMLHKKNMNRRQRNVNGGFHEAHC